MSRETTEARAAARHAADKWDAHRQDCPRCARAATSGGRGAGPCKQGTPLYLIHLASQNDLARIRELDKLPAPGQQELF